MSESDAQMCITAGPPVLGNGMGYMCTLPPGHKGEHEAWIADRMVASWPAQEVTDERTRT